MILKKFFILLTISTVALGEEFSPYEFVKNAQKNSVVHVFEGLDSTVTLTLPESIQGSGANKLTQDAQQLSAKADT